MNNYEILYIVENSLDDEAKTAVIEKYQKLVESLEGTVESVDKWGTRKFAYTINYKTEGYYVLMTFSANAEVPAEIERKMRIDDKIIRSMITRK